jgi:uroporphyrinogen-III synthase
MVQNKYQILFTGQAIDDGIKEILPSHLNLETLPFIETKLSIDPNALNDLKLLSNKNVFVVVTSQIAVHWLAMNVQENPNWTIACMSGQTKNALNALGWGEMVKFTANNGIDLAKIIADNIPSSNIIYFIGSKQRLANLPDFLTERGFQVKELVAYDTVPKQQSIDKNIDGIVFLSPSAVNSFFDQHTIDAEIKLFAIGNTTAQAIYKRTQNETIVSDGVSQSELFNKIINYYKAICH